MVGGNQVITHGIPGATTTKFGLSSSSSIDVSTGLARILGDLRLQETPFPQLDHLQYPGRQERRLHPGYAFPSPREFHLLRHRLFPILLSSCIRRSSCLPFLLETTRTFQYPFLNNLQLKGFCEFDDIFC